MADSNQKLDFQPMEIYWSKEDDRLESLGNQRPRKSSSSRRNNKKSSGSSSKHKQMTGKSDETRGSRDKEKVDSNKQLEEGLSRMATLKDLCADDKKRIANLVQELARIGDENEKLQRDKDQYESQMNDLIDQQEKVLKECEAAQSQLSQYQTLLTHYQQLGGLLEKQRIKLKRDKKAAEDNKIQNQSPVATRRSDAHNYAASPRQQSNVSHISSSSDELHDNDAHNSRCNDSNQFMSHSPRLPDDNKYSSLVTHQGAGQQHPITEIDAQQPNHLLNISLSEDHNRKIITPSVPNERQFTKAIDRMIAKEKAAFPLNYHVAGSDTATSASVDDNRKMAAETSGTPIQQGPLFCIGPLHPPALSSTQRSNLPHQENPASFQPLQPEIGSLSSSVSSHPAVSDPRYQHEQQVPETGSDSEREIQVYDERHHLQNPGFVPNINVKEPMVTGLNHPQEPLVSHHVHPQGPALSQQIKPNMESYPQQQGMGNKDQFSNRDHSLHVGFESPVCTAFQEKAAMPHTQADTAGERQYLAAQKEELLQEQARLRKVLSEQESMLRARQDQLRRQQQAHANRLRYFEERGHFPSDTSTSSVPLQYQQQMALPVHVRPPVPGQISDGSYLDSVNTSHQGAVYPVTYMQTAVPPGQPPRLLEMLVPPGSAAGPATGSTAGTGTFSNMSMSTTDTNHLQPRLPQSTVKSPRQGNMPLHIYEQTPSQRQPQQVHLPADQWIHGQRPQPLLPSGLADLVDEVESLISTPSSQNPNIPYKPATRRMPAPASHHQPCSSSFSSTTSSNRLQQEAAGRLEQPSGASHEDEEQYGDEQKLLEDVFFSIKSRT